jgi:hypothetical protein
LNDLAVIVFLLAPFILVSGNRSVNSSPVELTSGTIVLERVLVPIYNGKIL